MLTNGRNPFLVIPPVLLILFCIVSISAIGGSRGETTRFDLIVLEVDDIDTLREPAKEFLERLREQRPDWYASGVRLLRVRRPDESREAIYVARTSGSISRGSRVVIETQWEEAIQVTEGFVRRLEVHFVDQVTPAE